jgi:hypothetical protein
MDQALLHSLVYKKKVIYQFAYVTALEMKIWIYWAK